MELKPEHITPYLPWDLQCREYASKIDRKEMINSFIIGITMGGDSFVIDTIYNGITETLNSDEFKLILKPLSDLAKDKSQDAYQIRINLLELDDDVSILSYQLFGYLLEKHYDVFGLIPEGLAVDKNTLK